uniref:Putative RNA-directed DNA polymerase n=1 Tax=Schizaphis graminum TaxID=13262 RepID=A0A2S2PCN4_SCHGA
MPPNKPNKPTLTQGTMDWITFRSSLENKINLNISLKSPNDIDEAVNFLTKSIQETAWSCSSPPTSINTTKNLPLFTRSLIVEKRKARATWQRTRYPSDKRIFNNLTNKLKRHLAQIRSENFAKHLISLSSSDNSLWETTRKILRSQPSVPPLRKTDGTWAINDIEKSNIFRHHLDSTFKPHSDTLTTNQIHKVNHFLLCPLPMSLPPKHIRPSEVKYTIDKSVRKKTPGFDLITAEVASQLPKKVILLLTHIYNSMIRLTYFPALWKFSIIVMIPKPNKPPDIPSSY